MKLTPQKRQALTCIVEEAINAASVAQDALNTADDTKALQAVDELISAFLNTAKRLHDTVANVEV